MSEQAPAKPEAIEEALIAAPVAGSRVSLNPLAVGRLLAGALGDLRRIADGMTALPKLVESLSVIQGRVERLDDEVREMRAAVEGMGGDVTHLRSGIERLEPHLEDVSRAARPLRRLGERAWRREPPPPQ
jgi:ubiquinone biosynthesis protein UbiJ